MGRLAAIGSVVLLALPARSATAQERPLTLDRARVVQLARAHAPSVVVADARTEEARALHSGADAPALTNPELGVAAGPRLLPGNNVSTDVFVTLSWPIDLSGARGRRMELADERTTEAEAAADDVRRLAVADALDVWVRALGARDRVELETARAQLDDSLVATTAARRDAGTIGDGEVALATIVRAEGVGRLRAAEGSRDALLAELRARLGLAATTPVTLVGTLDGSAPPSLAASLATLPQRADEVRSDDAIRAARADAALQQQVGVPVPRVILNGAQDPELTATLGVALPLPIYQSNQTSTAVALAHVETAAAERRQTVALAEAELRAAYSVYLAARASLDALAASSDSIDDAEHLATRAYELGQSPLTSLLVARREAFIVRAALLEARLAVARARVAVARASGPVR